MLELVGTSPNQGKEPPRHLVQRVEINNQLNALARHLEQARGLRDESPPRRV